MLWSDRRTSNLIPFLAGDLFVGFLKSERLGAGPRTLLESDHDPFAFYRLPKGAAVLESIFLSLAASVGGFFPSPWFPCGAWNFEGSVSCFCEFIYCSVQLLWCFLIVPWGGEPYSPEIKMGPRVTSTCLVSFGPLVCTALSAFNVQQYTIYNQGLKGCVTVFQRFA